MDDLVKRLRAGTGGGKPWMDLHEEAADRIEALEHQVKAADASGRTRPMSKPRVKPLEWRVDDSQNEYAQAQYSVDRYCIEHRLHADDAFDLWIGPDATTATRFPTIEAAKAAAQADYEARILAALEPVTDGPNWEGFGRDLLESWPVRDVDGSELFDAALRNGLIQEIPGGYDPEQHIDAEGICPEKGDPWYEYAFK